MLSTELESLLEKVISSKPSNSCHEMYEVPKIVGLVWGRPNEVIMYSDINKFFGLFILICHANLLIYVIMNFLFDMTMSARLVTLGEVDGDYAAVLASRDGNRKRS